MLLLLLASCAGEPTGLLVQVRTDLVPVEEVAAIRTELYREVPANGEGPLRLEETRLDVDSPSELRVATFDGLSPGT
jgi:hypothetical protein